MKLTKLSVENWGVFRGMHEFNLTASNRYQDNRPLVIFTGHNGAGKTTLFQSIQLALYGSFALGIKVNSQEYDKYLSRRSHQYSLDGKTVVSKNCCIKLGVDYAQRGNPMHIEVTRNWEVFKSKTQEKLQILCNGQALDINQHDYQHWLLDIMPLGFLPLCSLDTERLDNLTSLQNHRRLLQDSLLRLLGLDIVELLQTDLDHYIVKKGAQKEQSIQKDVVNIQSELDGLNTQIDEIEREMISLQREHESLEHLLLQNELHLAAEGGTYAARRTELNKRLRYLETEINALSEKIREMCSQLLPFALTPVLSNALKRRLSQEADLKRIQIIKDFWQAKISDIQNEFKNEAFWNQLDIQHESRDILIQRILSLLSTEIELSQSENPPIVHDLAEPIREKLIDWINQTQGALPDQAKQLSLRLRELRSEKRQIEKDLQRAPDDDILAPIHVEITKTKSVIEDILNRRDGLYERLGALKYQRDEKARYLQRSIERLSAIKANEMQLSLAQKSKAVLRAYQQALIQNYVSALSTELVLAFNSVCQKENLLLATYIDPADFSILLRGVNGRELFLTEFSAGEAQIFGMALLLALRKVSKRKLPLLIDTPVARLDETHRRTFFKKFIPLVGEQIILFMTEAELDDETLAEAEPYLAHHYSLTHDEQSGNTSVHRVK